MFCYVTLPKGQAKQYIKADITYALTSVDGQKIFWDQEWDPETYKRLKAFTGAKLMNHKAAKVISSSSVWCKPDINPQAINAVEVPLTP